jgi:murein DD-endopeptidase MepM/ murein hydrolase activator NlpD
MKRFFRCLILSAFLASSCATHGPFYVGNPYGAPVSYGEGRHPGIDFDIRKGTPIIAASNGEVIYVGEPGRDKPHGGGIFVAVRHGDNFSSLYGHLEEVFVETGQLLKRGQLIGLSGASNNGYAHLHFGICKIVKNCRNYSQTYNPKRFWLDGEPQCFDPNMDYSNHFRKEITLPVACGEYANRLITNTKKKE